MLDARKLRAQPIHSSAGCCAVHKWSQLYDINLEANIRRVDARAELMAALHLLSTIVCQNASNLPAYNAICVLRVVVYSYLRNSIEWIRK